MDEFKGNPQVENKVANEFELAQENIIQHENPAIEEYNRVNEFDNETTQYRDNRAHKKTNALRALTTGVVAVIGLAVMGMTNLINVKMSASFNECEFQDSNIIYEVGVQDMTEKESLNAYLYLDNVLLEKIPLEDDDNDGIIKGMIELDSASIDEKLNNNDNVSIRYNIKLKGNVGLNVEREFDSYVVKIDKMTSVFEDINGECKCGIDGCYHFKMNFSDAYGIFSNFEAYLEDSEGNKAYCDFTDNLHDEQTIFVGSLKGSKAKLVISYDVKDEARRVIEEDIIL